MMSMGGVLLARPDRLGNVMGTFTMKECVMSADLRLGPIGQISRQVSDLPRAIEWYRDALGLPHLYSFGDLSFFDCGGVRLYLSVAEGGVAPVTESVIYFRVEDIQPAYDELRARGVEFVDEPHMIFQHESGMQEWMAFFTDPDGHLLAIMAQPYAGRPAAA
jgi:catechol 2,3-dioxygenase-like lactoylglutathione lyase family enzyme